MRIRAGTMQEYGSTAGGVKERKIILDTDTLPIHTPPVHSEGRSRGRTGARGVDDGDPRLGGTRAAFLGGIVGKASRRHHERRPGPPRGRRQRRWKQRRQGVAPAAT